MVYDTEVLELPWKNVTIFDNVVYSTALKIYFNFDEMFFDKELIKREFLNV